MGLTVDAVLATLLNGVFVGTLASVGCLLYKEHRLLNLAAAGWCCCGTWATAAATGAASFAAYGVVWLVILLCGTYVVLAAALQWSDRLFTKHATLYLFLGLGCHIAIEILGRNLVPTSSTTIIPDGLLVTLGVGKYDRVVLAVICVLITAAVEWFVRSRHYSRQTLAYREFSRTGNSVSRFASRTYLVSLLAIQMVLLVVLGVFAEPSNKGDFALTSRHMATSAIATIAVFGRPLRAFGASVGLAIIETLVYRIWPDSTLAFAVSLAAFILITIGLTRPIVGLALTPANTWIRSFTTSQKDFLIQVLVMAAAPAFLWLVWDRYRLSETRLMTIAVVLGFSALSYLSTRCCAIPTAAYPGFGASLAYVTFYSSAQPVQSAVWFVALFGFFLTYLFFVRYASHRVALVTDLSLILSIHELLGMAQVSGPEAILTMSGSSSNFSKSYFITWSLFVAVLGAAYLIHTTTRGRVIAYALSDPFLAHLNGLRSWHYLTVLCSTCLVVAFLLQLLLCKYAGSISADIADPQLGIACLLIGYIMASDNPLKGFLVGLCLYVLPRDILPLIGYTRIGQYDRLFLLFPIFFAIYSSPDRKGDRTQ